MRRLSTTACVLLLSSLASCRTALPPVVAPARAYPTTAAVIPLLPATAEEISVEQLALMLPRRPIVVGFDVDDTLIFSAPAFNALESDASPEPRQEESLAAKRQDSPRWREFYFAPPATAGTGAVAATGLMGYA